jgi:hypothetical protein
LPLLVFGKNGYTLRMGAGDLLSAVRLKLEEFFWKTQRAVAAFFAQNRAKTLALWGIAGAVAVILIVAGTTAVLRKAGEETPESPEMFSAERIPGEAFFLPEEPDFLPPAILYRERKNQWTAEDAAPFWTDPAVLDSDWRDNVEKYIDKLLESVP